LSEINNQGKDRREGRLRKQGGRATCLVLPAYKKFHTTSSCDAKKMGSNPDKIMREKVKMPQGAMRMKKRSRERMRWESIR
jgi:hypothetical protein